VAEASVESAAALSRRRMVTGFDFVPVCRPLLRYSERGGASTAHAGSAPKGWSMKKTQVPSGSLRCTSMP
jgi:hypothetical protein